MQPSLCFSTITTKTCRASRLCLSTLAICGLRCPHYRVLFYLFSLRVETSFCFCFSIFPSFIAKNTSLLFHIRYLVLWARIIKMLRTFWKNSICTSHWSDTTTDRWKNGKQKLHILYIISHHLQSVLNPFHQYYACQIHRQGYCWSITFGPVQKVRFTPEW